MKSFLNKKINPDKYFNYFSNVFYMAGPIFPNTPSAAVCDSPQAF
jgi:hypothetical protein